VKDKSTTSIKNFESALTELESLVTTLEDGKLSLERSLELFERGVKLSRYCHTKLEEAEKRIEVLTDQGEVQPAPNELSDSTLSSTE
jgi:exodeoxyribonuclease VII small subunit